MEIWRRIQRNWAWYATATVCLAALGVGLWLFFTWEEPQVPASLPVETVTDELPPLPVQTVEEEPIAEVVPEPVEVLQEEPAVMPEEPVEVLEPIITEAPVQTVSPLEGEVVAAFSVDALAYDPTLEDWRIHAGMDIAAPEGTAVLAACAGTVCAVEEDAMMGVTVTLSHEDGYFTTYANLQEHVPVKEGQKVLAGKVIGAVGTTAAAEAAQPPHLHFAVTKDGDAVNPQEFLDR